MGIPRFQLRPIKEEDCDLLFKWRNTEKVREASLTTEEIKYQDHLSWFKKQISGMGRVNLLFCTGDVPLGVVYFEVDPKNEVADFGFYKNPSDDTHNVGIQMEICALNYAFSTLQLRKLTCCVLSSNKRIIKFHKEFGFEIEGCQVQQVKRGGSFLDLYFLAIFSEKWTLNRSRFSNYFDQ